MKDCGFNIAGIMQLDEVHLAEAAGMECFLLDPRAWRADWTTAISPLISQVEIADLVSDISDRPAVIGHYVVDEPAAALFPNIGTITHLLGEIDPNRYIYNNLHPNWAPMTILGGTYQDYVDQYFSNCFSNVLMVDNYCLMGTGGSGANEDPAYFYSNMQTMRDEAFKNNVPFWSIILSMPHYMYAVPTFGNMALQAYGSLAYGSRGLGYFCYFTNSNPASYLGPIDVSGNKTATWDMVEAVNSEIAALAPTINSLTCIRNYFFGSIPAGGSSAPSDANIQISGTAPDLLIGEFVHEDGTPYILIVNRNTSTSASITCSFPKFRSVARVSPDTGALVPYMGDTISIPPGNGMLVQLNR